MTAFLQQYISPALPVILWLGRALVSGLAVWLLVRCCLSLFRGKDRESWGVSSVQKVYVQANISNQYGAFYAQVKYDVKWTDKNGVEHTEQKSTNAYYFKATSDTVFYEAIIPAQKAGSTVYWLIVVTNENGLSSVTEAQQYSVYAI